MCHLSKDLPNVDVNDRMKSIFTDWSNLKSNFQDTYSLHPPDNSYTVRFL